MTVGVLLPLSRAPPGDFGGLHVPCSHCILCLPLWHLLHVCVLAPLLPPLKCLQGRDRVSRLSHRNERMNE